MNQSEIDPDTRNSPGTVDDPKLERERARQTTDREAESRGSDKTKLEGARRGGGPAGRRPALAGRVNGSLRQLPGQIGATV